LRLDQIDSIAVEILKHGDFAIRSLEGTFRKLDPGLAKSFAVSFKGIRVQKKKNSTAGLIADTGALVLVDSF
jgi:hypothetical protein